MNPKMQHSRNQEAEKRPQGLDRHIGHSIAQLLRRDAARDSQPGEHIVQAYRWWSVRGGPTGPCRSLVVSLLR